MPKINDVEVEGQIPLNGRKIDIDSPLAQDIIESLDLETPKSIKTWTIFKNANNTLEGVEAITFVMRQPALDEIEKEDDNIIFMSDKTMRMIMNERQQLKKENEGLKKELSASKNFRKEIQNDLMIEDKENDELIKENKRLEKENEELKEEIRQLIYGRTSEETYTLFGKPIKYWENLENALEEIREIVLENPWEETDNWIKGKILKVLESEGE